MQITTAAAIRMREVGWANMCSSLDEQVFGVKQLAVSRYAGAVLLRFRHRTLPRQGRPHLMGIVNVTPDSFYDGGATATTDLAVARALAVVSEGATVIDVGGMTARPGVVLSAADERARVLPVLEGIRAAGCEAVVSVDTYRADVAAAALEAGADMINDHTGLTDGDLAAAVARARRRAGRDAPGARAEAGAGRPLRHRPGRDRQVPVAACRAGDRCRHRPLGAGDRSRAGLREVDRDRPRHPARAAGPAPGSAIPCSWPAHTRR